MAVTIKQEDLPWPIKLVNYEWKGIYYGQLNAKTVDEKGFVIVIKTGKLWTNRALHGK